MLKEIAAKTKERTGSTTLYAEDFMDDGSPIKLQIDINENEVDSCLNVTFTESITQLGLVDCSFLLWMLHSTYTHTHTHTHTHVHTRIHT